VDNTQREMNKKILDRIASDPTFREELLDDPKGAMERAGFKWDNSADVSGYGFFSMPGPISGDPKDPIIGTTGPISGGGDPGATAPGSGGGGIGSTAPIVGGGGKDPGVTTDPLPPANS